MYARNNTVIIKKACTVYIHVNVLCEESDVQNNGCLYPENDTAHVLALHTYIHT